MGRVAGALVALLPILLSLLASVLPAQTTGALTINVSGGFDGYHKPGRWCPVFVTISNQPTHGSPGDRSLDFKGTLVVESRPEDNDVAGFRFTRDVEVPAFSTQRFIVYAKFPSGNVTRSMDVRDASGKLISQRPFNVQPVPTDQILIVVASDAIGSLMVPRLRPELDTNLSAKVSMRGMPDSWMGYDSADVVVLPSWDGQALTEGVQQALSDWTAGGGSLVFLGGRNSGTYALAADRPILPASGSESVRAVATPQGVTLQSLLSDPSRPQEASESSFLATRITPADEAEVLLTTTAGEPLFVRRALGTGHTYFLAFDLESMSPELSDVLSPRWHAVMPLPNLGDSSFTYVRTLKRGRGGEGAPSGSDGLRILTGSAGRPPNYFVIGLICVIYALIVGPANFWVLGRMKRFDLAWVTVPTIVALFSLLIFGLGRATRGGGGILREVTTEVTASRQRAVFEHTTMAAFNTVQGDLRFEPTRPRAAVGDESRWDEYQGLRTAGWVPAMATGAGTIGINPVRPIVETSADGVEIPEWTARPYEIALVQSRGPAELPGALIGDVVARSGNIGPEGRGGEVILEGRIVNMTGRRFADAFLVMGEHALAIGELAPGESYTLPGDPLRTGAWSGTSWRKASDLIAGFGMPPANKAASETATEVNRHNFSVAALQRFFPPLTGLSILPPRRGELHFLGFSEQPVTSVLSSMAAEDKTHSLLTCVRIPLRIEAGPLVTLPTRMTTPRLVRDDSNPGSTVAIDGEGRLDLMGSKFIMVYESAVNDPGVAVTELRFDVLVQPGQSDKVDFEVYNHKARRWDSIVRGAVLSNLDERGDSGVYALPITGRTWLRVAVDRDPSKTGIPGQGGFGGFSTTTLTDAGFAMTFAPVRSSQPRP